MCVCVCVCLCACVYISIKYLFISRIPNNVVKSELLGTQASRTADFQSAVIKTFKEASSVCLLSARYHVKSRN